LLQKDNNKSKEALKNNKQENKNTTTTHQSVECRIIFLILLALEQLNHSTI
jgi:hypothetical protein